MSFSDDMRAVANELLANFDERTGDDRLMLLRPGVSVWNPTTVEYDVGLPTLITLVGVVTQYDKSLIDGTTIMSGDLKITLTSAQEVKMNDKIIVDGDQYSVVGPNPSAYTGKSRTIVYFVQARK